MLVERGHVRPMAPLGFGVAPAVPGPRRVVHVAGDGVKECHHMVEIELDRFDSVLEVA